MTPVEILKASRRLIELGGWCSGRSRDGAAHCAGAAVQNVSAIRFDLVTLSPEFITPNARVALEALVEVRQEAPEERPGYPFAGQFTVADEGTRLLHQVANYNDEILMAPEEVLAWFDDAIAFLEGPEDLGPVPEPTRELVAA